MLVRNNTDIKFEYRAHGKCYTINPKTVTSLEDDGLLTEKELKDTYGTRIRIVKEDSPAPELRVTPLQVPKAKEVKLEERTCDLTDKILGEILDSVKTEMEIADSQIDNDWDLNLKSEQKIQEALEDIENKNKDIVSNNENKDAPDYKAETVQTVKNNSVSEKKPGRTSTRRTGTKRASRKKV